ncbi:hypothetical protein BK658_09335 [Pseudomonas brassicacearum]|uniref:Uncharacterized protein n=1 Tax=Pseudomonas brassicacearum TaxID=930166 RepID=A0A423GU35_9PSED|nr:hypothetical protein BK658_09335 [Pseudomonas brassicacearum]
MSAEYRQGLEQDACSLAEKLLRTCGTVGRNSDYLDVVTGIFSSATSILRIDRQRFSSLYWTLMLGQLHQSALWAVHIREQLGGQSSFFTTLLPMLPIGETSASCKGKNNSSTVL